MAENPYLKYVPQQAAPQAPAQASQPPAFIPGVPKPQAPEKPRDPPSGYNWGPNGTLVPIPGGPADKPQADVKLNVIPGSAVTGIQENLKTYQGISEALSQLQGRPGSIGPGTGFLGETFTNWNDPDGTTTRAAIAKIGAYKIHDLSGAAVTLSEAPRFSPFVPTVTDTPEVAQQKLQGLQKELETAIKEANDFYSPANGYRQYQTPGMQQFIQGGATPGQTGGPQEPPPAYGTPDPTADGSPPTLGEQGRPLPMSDPGAQSPIGAGAEKRTRYIEPNPAYVTAYRKKLAQAARAGDVNILLEYLDSVGDKDREGAIKQYQYLRRFPNYPVNQMPVQGQYVDEALSAGDQALNNAAESPVGAYAARTGNAVTLNSLDNIAGAVGGNGERVRNALAYMGDRHPFASAAGDMTGATMATLGAEAALARAGIAAGLTRVTGANALTGFGQGFAGTDYNSRGEAATIGDRIVGGAKQGTANTALGLAATGTMKALQSTVAPTYRAGIRAVGGDKNVAINQVSRALSEDGLTPRSAAAKIQGANARGVPMAIADLGENSRELLASVGRARGPSRSIVKSATVERQAEQLERLSSAVRRDLGPTANIRDLGDELMGRAKDESAPYYQQAFQAPGAGAASEKLKPLLNRPSIKRAMVRANRIAAEEGRDPKALGFDINAQGEVVLSKTPSWETLHYVKTGLDDVIESYRDPTSGKLNLDAEGRLINNTKNQLLKIMDATNPSYKEARALYAGPASMRDALELGSKALTRSPDDVAANIQNLGPAEMEMYRLGLRKAIVDALGSKGDFADKVHAMSGTPKVRAVLSKVLGGSKNYDRFIATLNDEAQLSRTYQAVNGNSATAGRVAFDETTQGENIAAGLLDVGAGYVQGGTPNAVMRAVNRVSEAGRLGVGQAGDNARAEIARLLSTNDPEQLMEIARQAQRAAAKARLGKRRSSAVSSRAGTVGGAIGAALGPGTTLDQ